MKKLTLAVAAALLAASCGGTDKNGIPNADPVGGFGETVVPSHVTLAATMREAARALHASGVQWVAGVSVAYER